MNSRNKSVLPVSARAHTAMLRRAARRWVIRGWDVNALFDETQGGYRVIGGYRENQPRRLHVRASGTSSPGVYGLRGLHSPEDFGRLAADATATSESIATDLRAGRRFGIHVIDDLDEISDVVCSVVDVAELCRNTHRDPAWVRAAEGAYVSLQRYVSALNADRGLYDALVNTHEAHLRAERGLARKANGLAVRATSVGKGHGRGNGDDGRATSREGDNDCEARRENSNDNLLPPEAARVALTLRRDFERGGIHLYDTSKLALENASADVVRHGMAFQRNLVDADQLGSVNVSSHKLNGAPRALMARVGNSSGVNTGGNSGRVNSGTGTPDGSNTSSVTTLPLDNRTLGTCMRYVTDRDTRETIYKAAHRNPAANKNALEGLLTSRAEVAKLLYVLGLSQIPPTVYRACLTSTGHEKEVTTYSTSALWRLEGYQSHAAYATEPLLAGHPDAVRFALRGLRCETNERATQEFEHMGRFFGNGDGHKAGGTHPRMGKQSRPQENIQSWDKSFLAGRARDFQNSHSNGKTTAAVSEYFPLHKVVRGAGELLEKVFGVRFELTDVPANEKWCHEAQKVSVSCSSTGEPFGTIYLDLNHRPGKFPHAAHFVVRCSRDVHFVDPNGNRTGDETFTTSKQPQPPTTFRQLPSVALVTNFGGEHSRFGDTNLSHAELETFLHELGHAVHSVLSTTKYQHLSGTRCASDLVEVPSHVFEYFAWDADALKLLSGHVTTGESIPDELITQLKKGKELFAASDLRQQLMFASVDLETHALGLGDNELSSSGSITSETIRDIAGRISHEMGQNSLTDYSHDTNPEKDAAWELRFGHVVGYASSYYSYVYAKTISAQVWDAFFAGGNSLEKNSGVAISKGLLSHGGAVAPEVLLKQLLGPDALRDVDVTEYAYDNVTGVGPLTTTSDNIREYGTTRQRVNGVVPNHDSLLKELRDGNPYR